ncbi:MAG: DUF2961 domain-containing protein [Planctomycetes bacterium]|nr:DUF2961 domain-containing protein [Planctomycetota bacterium]
MKSRARVSSLVASIALAAPQLCAQISDNFYELFPSRVHTMVKASYDPDDRINAMSQGNDDGFSGVNLCEAYRYVENGTPVSVLADIEGRAGVMGLFFRNFWTDAYGLPKLPTENNRTRIWVDDPVRYDSGLFDFFRNADDPGGQVAPFDGPFTGNRSGGYLTHAQIRWNSRFRIALDDNSFDNAARFHRVSLTLASPEGELPMPDKAAWEAIANRPGFWPHQAHRHAAIQTLTVPGNGGRSHFDLTGPGTLLELTFEVPEQQDWTDLWARFTWDNAAVPQVSLPLRYLGGMISPPYVHPVHSLLLDNDGGTRCTCWFPMPFRQHARIEIENRGAQAVPVKVTRAFKPGMPSGDWGHFVAWFRREITGTGEPFVGPRFEDCHGMLRFLMLEDFADTSGRIPDMHMSHLEGDVCIRVNGNRGDDHTFAASETGIGRWGWYITPADKPFCSDTSFQSSLRARYIGGGVTEGRRIMGSTYLFDPVHFVDGIDIVLEHGLQNSSNADYSLVAFFYLQQGAARRTIAEIDIGNLNPLDPRSEPSNNVHSTSWQTYTQQGNFLRDQFYGTPALSETVRHVRDFLRFDVQRPSENDHPLAIGLRLDRLGGPSTQVCQADVFVDGEHAGLLHVFTHNGVFPWKEGGECEIELPIAVTKRKAGMTIELRPRPGSDPLKVARIWVYEYVK